jgi:hypothetical protein
LLYHLVQRGLFGDESKGGRCSEECLPSSLLLAQLEGQSKFQERNGRVVINKARDVGAERALALSLDSFQGLSRPFVSTMTTASAPIANGFHYPDWEDRYYHVDQVLDRPGPRTDPDSFMAGDGVSNVAIKILTVLHVPLSVGKELSSDTVQDSCHRRGWAGV